MSNILGVPLDAAYYVVTSLAGLLTPLAGAWSVALAIVLFTIAVRLVLLPFGYYALRGQVAQSRLAPQLQALRHQHRRDPERLNREVRGLYRANGTSMFAGYLPLLLQWPFLTVMYLLFRSATINGAPNSLLRHHLFAASLSAHWLTAPGPLSLQGAVFAAIFALLALTAYLSARLNRRLFPRPTPGPQRPTAANSQRAAGTSTKRTAPGSARVKGAGTKRAAVSSSPPIAGAGTKRAAAPSSPPIAGVSTKRTAAPKTTSGTSVTSSTSVTPAAMPSWLTNVLPLVTVVFAAFLPLAGGLYLLTTTAWTLLERRTLARHVQQAPPPAVPAAKTAARAGVTRRSGGPAGGAPGRAAHP